MNTGFPESYCQPSWPKSSVKPSTEISSRDGDDGNDTATRAITTMLTAWHALVRRRNEEMVALANVIDGRRNLNRQYQ